MTTMSLTCLTESQQLLIDARLDTIDRMLMGRVPRQDRIAIAREVESQIHELLGDRDPQTITGDDVIEILRRLDPPEAYLSNDVDDISHDHPRQFKPTPLVPAKQQHPISREGRIGGIAGIGSFVMILFTPLIYFLALSLESEATLLIGFVVAALVGFALGTCGLVLSIRGRHQGILPVFGIVMASVAMPIWTFGPPLTYFLLTQ